MNDAKNLIVDASLIVNVSWSVTIIWWNDLEQIP